MPTKIQDIVHPDYNPTGWEKYRAIIEGGKTFIEKYLKKFSHREDLDDYADRVDMSYVPGHSKSAIVEVKNAINNRLIDVNRQNGHKTYMDAVNGQNGGVDFNGNTMNGFLGRSVLLELLGMGKVGVYVDKPQITTETRSKADTAGVRPYLYTYKAEDIRSWKYNNENKLESLLLRSTDFITDKEFNLPSGTATSYLLFEKTADGVIVQQFNEDSDAVSVTILNLIEIPCVILELSNSLLRDIAEMQVALLNLASSDLNYAIKSNFPFYIEQFDPKNNLDAFTRQAAPVQPSSTSNDSLKSGQDSQAQKAKDTEMIVGSTQGRRYGRGLEAPSFIHPSPEPLMASMEKQKAIRSEIREVINLTVSEITAQHASAESKRADEVTKEEGISQIGLELEHGERQILGIWNDYQKFGGNSSISYPETWKTRTDKDRRQEAEELKELRPTVPSNEYQKVITKEIAVVTVGHKVDSDTFDKIISEIDAAEVVETNPDVIREDHEAGFVSTGTASKARGYPEGEVEQAKKDHAERAARIAAAQSKAGDAARGVKDTDPDPDPKLEKKLSQDSAVKTGNQ